MKYISFFIITFSLILIADRVDAAVSLSRAFGGKVLSQTQEISCPGYGPYQINNLTTRLQGIPFYRGNSIISDMQKIEESLKETRKKINDEIKYYGSPKDETLQEEKDGVENLKRNREMLKKSPQNDIVPGKWILGLYSFISNPCYTNTTPPVPIPAFNIKIYGVSR